MAKLISEDKEVITTIELVFLKDKLKDKKYFSWIPYKLLLHSGDRFLIYEKLENDSGAGDYVFSLKPVNEVQNLVDGIKNFLLNEDKSTFLFEPLEPSFEILFERSHKGFSVHLWIDAGNVISDHYTWDGFGVRFFTAKKNINSFIEELLLEKDICQKEKI